MMAHKLTTLQTHYMDYMNVHLTQNEVYLHKVKRKINYQINRLPDEKFKQSMPCRQLE